MKKRRRLRKGLAMLLSLAMVAGLVPAMSGGANTVQAASGTGTELSVSAYATKEQLMDGTFAPKEDGTAENYGKIVFGKNSSGEAQEWYILGKDSGVSEDNTIIFAASPIAKGQQFNSSASDKTYICEAGTGYWGDAVGVTVHANHYGASDLRVALRDMAADTSYFTTAEQGLMNATTVTTMDAWEDVPYTTTDKLYALAAADGYVPSYNPIKVGSSDSTVLAMSSYWSNVRPFWLRSPYDPFSTSVLEAVPSLFVNYIGVGNSLAVQPASNLNLSSVLFASSAKAASSDTVESGRIADGTAMTLRLDTSATDPATAVGTVIYDASGGVIAAQKNADATGTVSLVVQGKGTIGETEQDWYYSVPVGGTIVVTKEQIQQELSLSAAPNLAECKIWLETTIDNVAYASTAKAVGTIQVEKVNSVAVTDVKPPVGGEAFNTAASCNTKGIASITPAITYTTTGENGEKEVTGIADWNTTYKAAFTLTTGIVDDVAYVFGDSVSVTVDEESLSDALAPRVDGTVTVTREFTTAKRKIVSVAAPEVPTENTFTTYYGYERYTEVLSDGGNNELGKQAMVTLEGTDLVDSIPEPMDVTWTVANADGAPYDRTPGAKNTFRWIIPESEFLDYDASACQGYDAGTITGTVAITNKDYTPVTIIGENVTVTYHGEDTLDVSQYFNIDEHAGTPTYEVLENSTGTGTLEGATLTMTTLGTFVVKVSTPINDVYNKGERTLTITVNKAAPNVTALPTVADRIYHPSTVLADTDITDGTVTDVFGNSLAGTWSWKKADVVPTVDNDGYVAVFTPKDTVHYQSVEKTISVNVSKATPYIKKAPTATAITYGEALSASTLKDAVVCYSESDEEAVKGTFTWKEAATKPTVADSDKTEYDVVFTPTDAENYNTVETKITLTVNKAASAPGLPNSTMDVDYGKEKVSDITTLPEGWAWQDEDQDKALTVGTAVKATAVYTGADKGNYEVESVEISITRECTHATTEVKNEKDATCTEKGYTGDTCCTVCGKVITAGTDINALGHDFAAEFTVDKEATCMEEGSKSKHCSRCDAKSEVTEIPKHVDSNNDNICDTCGAKISFIITGRILTDTGASIEGEMTGLANYKNMEEVTLTVPVIAGYNFVGWYEYCGYSPCYAGDNLCKSRTYTFTAEADRDLVAVYKPIGSAELTIDGGKSFTINGDSQTRKVTVTYALGVPITVVCNDSDFEYWKNSAGMVVSRNKSYTFTVTGRETISAVFNTIAENKATVVFESYYGQVIARNQYAAGATLAETPGLPFRYGYTALGWDYNGDGTYDAETDTFEAALTRGFASENKLVTILPVYQLNETTYQITVENGTGAGTYKQNEVVTVVANAAADGYKFSHWADNAGNILSYNEKYQFYAAKNITVTAVYVDYFEEVEAKGTTEIVDKYADKANGKLTFVSMSTVPEGCTINKAGMILTDDSSVASSEDGFNASTAKYALGNAWSGNAYRYTVNKKNVSVGDTWYVRAYLVYTDAEGNVNTVYGKIESLTMPE